MNAASIAVVGIVVALAALAVVRNAKRKDRCACGWGGCGGSCGGDCAERHAGRTAAPDDGDLEAKKAN